MMPSVLVHLFLFPSKTPSQHDATALMLHRCLTNVPPYIALVIVA